MGKRKTGLTPRGRKPKPVEPDRVEQVIRWLIDGNRDAVILESISESWPDQAITPLINAAVAQLAQSADFETRVVVGWCFEATKEIYRRMIETGDLVGALRAVKQMNDLAARHGNESPAPEETVE